MNTNSILINKYK